MPANTGQFSQLIAPGLRFVFFDKFKDLPSEYDRIANVLTSTRNYEDEVVVAGLGPFASKPEAGLTEYDQPIQGSSVRYTMAPFGLGYRITHELYQDELYGVMNKMSGNLAISARNTIETQFWSIFNDAFSGSIFTGQDGFRLCYATGHTLLGGGTYANQPSSDVDVSITALQAAVVNFENCVDERNMPINLKPQLVISGPNQKFILKEIFKSEYKPFTANNEVNSMLDEGMTYMISHYLTDTDAWFVLSAKAMHDIKFFWRERLQFFNGDDFDTGDAKFRGYMRFTEGFTDWRGVYGSSGG